MMVVQYSLFQKFKADILKNTLLVKKLYSNVKTTQAFNGKRTILMNNLYMRIRTGMWFTCKTRNKGKKWRLEHEIKEHPQPISSSIYLCDCLANSESRKRWEAANNY